MVRVCLLGCLLVCALSSATGEAAPEDAHFERLKGALRVGSLPPLVAALSDEAIQDLAKDPEVAEAACDGVAARIAAIAAAARFGEDADVHEVVARVTRLALTARKAKPGSLHGLCAHGSARLTEGRALRAMGQEAAPKLWTDAALLFREAAWRTSLGTDQLLADAVQALIEAAPPAARSTWIVEAYADARDAANSPKATRDERIAYAQLAWIHVDERLGAKDKAGAKKLLAKALEQVSRTTPDKPGEWRLIGAAWNGLVQLAKPCGLKTEHEIRCIKDGPTSRNLSYAVPIGWNDRFAVRGYSVRKWMRHDLWGATIVELEAQPLRGGMNAASQRDIVRDGHLPDLDRVSKLRKRLTRRLNRALRKADGYERHGLKDGQEHWNQGWFFKGNVHRFIFGVKVHRRGGTGGTDAGLEHFLSSIREKPE